MQVMSIAPRYDQYSDAWDTSITVNVMGEDVRFFHAKKKGVDRVFVDHHMFLSKVRPASRHVQPDLLGICVSRCSRVQKHALA